MDKIKTSREIVSDLIKNLVKDGLIDVGDISDNYHTMKELYQHRCLLYVLTCKCINSTGDGEMLWKSQIHSDGSSFKGWFILGIGKDPGKQITYHLPMDYWQMTNFVTALDKAPEFDGHSSEDVIQRIKQLIKL